MRTKIQTDMIKLAPSRKSGPAIKTEAPRISNAWVVVPSDIAKTTTAVRTTVQKKLLQNIH